MAREYKDYEGELSRSLDFLGVAILGIQDTSGLAIDAMNTWNATRMLLMSSGAGGDLEKKLQRPICTYRANYVNCKRDEAHIEQIMSVAKPKALLAFDDQVREYNALPLEEKLTGVIEEYAARCETIIRKGVK